ncbi:unnamed protein product [Symbiodinium sp. CCMP2592]|nr:unnamed protein product [Symbiodinium sp. CCMP2592]
MPPAVKMEVKMEPEVKTEVGSPSRRCRVKTEPAAVEQSKQKKKQVGKPSAWEVRVAKIKKQIRDEVRKELKNSYSRRLRKFKVQQLARQVALEKRMDTLSNRVQSFLSKMEEEYFFGEEFSASSDSETASEEQDPDYAEFIDGIAGPEQVKENTAPIPNDSLPHPPFEQLDDA